METTEKISQTKRPVTGKLMVAGDFYKHVGYGIAKSWLATENPEVYVFAKDDFSIDKEGSLGQRFIGPALEENLPSILLDFPMARDNKVIKTTQGITVLFLPEGSPWVEAIYICTIPWKDMEVVENEIAEWRKWDKEWFISLIEASLKEPKTMLVKAEEEVADIKERCAKKQTCLEEIQRN